MDTAGTTDLTPWELSALRPFKIDGQWVPTPDALLRRLIRRGLVCRSVQDHDGADSYYITPAGRAALAANS